VGFIHKLPHTLVSAFRATLEEINDADLLLHVIDISNPHFQQQRQAVYKVLEEIEVTGKTIIEINNKIDLMPNCSSPLEQSNSICISAITGTGIPDLLQKIDSLFSADPLAHAHFVFSQKEGAEISRLCRHSRLIHRSYESNLVMLEVEAPRSVLNQFQAWEKKTPPAHAHLVSGTSR
jgi:GTP-binding protein HflX